MCVCVRAHMLAYDDRGIEGFNGSCCPCGRVIRRQRECSFHRDGSELLAAPLKGRVSCSMILVHKIRRAGGAAAHVTHH